MNGAAIQQYLLQKGWRPKRIITASRDRIDYVEDHRIDFFSTMLQIPGGPSYLCCYWFNDGLERSIKYGLSEKGKPPTLIFPRPRGAHDDDSMNRIMQKYTAEEIYEAMFDRSIRLEP